MASSEVDAGFLNAIVRKAVAKDKERTEADEISSDKDKGTSGSSGGGKTKKRSKGKQGGNKKGFGNWAKLMAQEKSLRKAKQTAVKQAHRGGGKGGKEVDDGSEGVPMLNKPKWKAPGRKKRKAQSAERDVEEKDDVEAQAQAKRQRVEEERAQAAERQKQEAGEALFGNSDSTEATAVLGMDCEMVGVGDRGKESVLARCSVVNTHGNTVYDEFVQPQEWVTDFRTKWSGVRAKDMYRAKPFKQVQKEVADLLKDRIVVGHDIANDFAALMMSHPKHLVRDTALYKPYKTADGRRKRGLKKLTKEHFGIDIQSGEHSSVDDARCTLMLYLRVRRDWERQLRLQTKMAQARTRKKDKAKADGKKAKADSKKKRKESIFDSAN